MFLPSQRGGNRVSQGTFKRDTKSNRDPAFTFVESFFGLRHHQGDIVGSVLQDVHHSGVRETLEVHVVNREEAVTCNIDGKIILKKCRNFYSVTHTRKKGAERQQPTGFEAPVDICRAPGCDGADDGAQI